MLRIPFTLLMVFLMSSFVEAADYMVYANTNTHDINPGDGACQSPTVGDCSLVAAIEEANAHPGPDTIVFAYPLNFDPYIAPTPDITDALTIDGSSQYVGNRPGIKVSSAGWDPLVDRGFRIISVGRVTIKGIEFYGSGTGITVSGEDVTIGGPNPTDKNIFQNTLYGIYNLFCTNLIIRNNWFGFVGASNLLESWKGPDEYSGIAAVRHGGSSGGSHYTINNNLFGEYETAIDIRNWNEVDITDNVIGIQSHASNVSFPCGEGVRLQECRGNISDNLIAQNTVSQISVGLINNPALTIEHNYIGSTYFPAAGKGIVSNGVPYNSTVILEIKNNIIRNNDGYGVELTSNYAKEVSDNDISQNMSGGIAVLASSSGVVLKGNRIYENGDSQGFLEEDGIFVNESSGYIFGNSIGVDGPNQGHGIRLLNSANNTIGGLNSADANIIGGNYASGVYIEGAGSRQNAVGGNIIGHVYGFIPPYDVQPNGNHGIALYDGAEANRVGLIGDLVAPNTIVSNKWSGIVAQNSNHNVIAHNYIGQDQKFNTLGNGYYGVHIFNGNNNTVKNNVIANNGKTTKRAGIAVEGGSSFGNYLRENSVYDNGDKSIILLDGANSGVNPPTLERSGYQLSGTTYPGSEICFYSGNRVGDSIFFEGETLSDSSGNFSWQKTGGFRGKYVTAASTVKPTYSTSELSLPVPGAFPYILFNHLYRNKK